MSVESVEAFFSALNLNKKILFFEDTSTVDKAAASLGVTPGEIAKSLLFQVQDHFVMIVMAGDKRIDNRKFKDYFKTKAKMPEFETVKEITGHPVGGVCPFGLANPVKIYLDESLKDYEIVYPAAGAPNAAVEMTVEELEKVTNGQWIDVAQSNGLQTKKC